MSRTFTQVPNVYEVEPIGRDVGTQLFQKTPDGKLNGATIAFIVVLTILVVGLIIAIIAVALSPMGSNCGCSTNGSVAGTLVNSVLDGSLGNKIQNVKSIWSSGAQKVEQVVQADVPKIEDAVKATLPKIENAVKADVPKIENAVKAAAQKVKADVPKIESAVKATLPKIENAVKVAAQDAVQFVQKEAPQVKTAIEDVVEKIKQDAPKAVQVVGSVMDEGKQLLDKLRSGSWAIIKAPHDNASLKEFAHKIAKSTSDWISTVVLERPDLAKLLDLDGSGIQIRRMDDGVAKEPMSGPVSVENVEMYLKRAASSLATSGSTKKVTFSTHADEWNPDIKDDDSAVGSDVWSLDDSRQDCFDFDDAQKSVVSEVCQDDLLGDEDIQDPNGKIIFRAKTKVDHAFLPSLSNLEYLDMP